MPLVNPRQQGKHPMPSTMGEHCAATRSPALDALPCFASLPLDPLRQVDCHRWLYRPFSTPSAYGPAGHAIAWYFGDREGFPAA